jgi:hypothetical protein
VLDTGSKGYCDHHTLASLTHQKPSKINPYVEMGLKPGVDAAWKAEHHEKADDKRSVHHFIHRPMRSAEFIFQPDIIAENLDN